MAWINITEAYVQTRLTGAEVTALKTVALASGQTDPLPEIVEQVVDEVRGHVAAGGNTLGSASTIPEKLLSAALAIIRFRLTTRLPKFTSDDNRRREYEDAVRLMERVADGKFRVEEPIVEDTEESSGPSPSTSKPDRHFSRDEQEGI